MFLIQKYTQYKAAQAEQQKRKVTEKELAQLNHKIDKLLSKLDEHEPEIAENQDDECVVCVNAKASMQTWPCGHKVVCRKCFVKTIQMAVAQRLLPLRCVLCRAKILRLKHAFTGPLPTSASQHTIGSNWYHVPQSASLYSVSSTMSGVSGVSGVSSASSCSSASSYKTCTSGFSSASLKKRTYTKQGYQPLRTSSPSPSQSPERKSGERTSAAKKDTAPHGHKVSVPKTTNNSNIVPENNSDNNSLQNPPAKGKLSLIREFQREFANGKSKTISERKGSASSQRSGSTRIKCARHLVSQAQTQPEDVATRSKSSTSVSTVSASTSSIKKGSDCNSGFRRVTPPPTSQSCHSFRLSRHDTVAPASSSFFKKGSLQTIPDESDATTDSTTSLSHIPPQ